MKPTIGRIVHFASFDANTIPLHPLAAIITHVHPRGYVDLTVFLSGGMMFQTDIPFADQLRAGCWTWPDEAP